MPDYMDVRPDELLRAAKEHELAAARIRKWGEIPHAWLAEFTSGYGTIADPVRAALTDYYDRRHAAAEHLAANHEQSRDALLAAAAAFEDNDQNSGGYINQSSGFADAAPAGPTPGALPAPAPHVRPGPDTPMVNGTPPAQPSASVPTTASVPDQTGHSVPASTPPVSSAASPATSDPSPATSAWSPWSPTASAPPPTAWVPQLDESAPTGPTPLSVGMPEPGTADIPGGTATDANGFTGMPSGPAPLPTGPIPAAPVPSGANMSGRIPAPLPTGPLAAAVHANKDRQSLPSLVVGEQVDDDLLLARTLLGAILAQVADSAPGLEWAVGVGRTSDGPLILLTSTEGRGWLPPGLFLPVEVVLPWRWDFVLEPTKREAIAALEGTSDPARILAEIGLLEGRWINARASALVSSTAIPDNLRTALGDNVALEGWVSAAESAVDLSSLGAGLVDRLALSGPKKLAHQAAQVSEADIKATCLELARAADAQVSTAVSVGDGRVSEHRAWRRQILDALRSGRPVPASWWDQIRVADGVLATALQSRRVDVSHLPVGARLDTPGTDALRSMVFERRAVELLLLLAAGEPDRQTLRDAYYTYGQIVEHPLFPAHESAAQATNTTSTGRAAPAVHDAPRVDSGVPRLSSISVGSVVGHGGAPPSIADILKGQEGAAGSSEQRRA